MDLTLAHQRILGQKYLSVMHEPHPSINLCDKWWVVKGCLVCGPEGLERIVCCVIEAMRSGL